jgi:hypothetical protein
VRKIEVEGTYTVESDGRTVWVNSPVRMVGRFSAKAFEVIEGDGFQFQAGPDPEHPHIEQWAAFVTAMQEQHGVDVSEGERLIDWTKIEAVEGS